MLYLKSFDRYIQAHVVFTCINIIVAVLFFAKTVYVIAPITLTWFHISAKVVEDSEEAETKVRRMFADASDQNDIQYEKFTQVVDQLAAEQNMTHDQASPYCSVDRVSIVYWLLYIIYLFIGL